MKKKIIKKYMKKLIGRFGNVTFNFHFIIIYIIHKMLVLLKHHLNYLKDSIFKCFLRSIIDFSFC